MLIEHVSSPGKQVTVQLEKTILLRVLIRSDAWILFGHFIAIHCIFVVFIIWWKFESLAILLADLVFRSQKSILLMSWPNTEHEWRALLKKKKKKKQYFVAFHWCRLRHTEKNGSKFLEIVIHLMWATHPLNGSSFKKITSERMMPSPCDVFLLYFSIIVRENEPKELPLIFRLLRSFSFEGKHKGSYNIWPVCVSSSFRRLQCIDWDVQFSGHFSSAGSEFPHHVSPMFSPCFELLRRFMIMSIKSDHRFWSRPKKYWLCVLKIFLTIMIFDVE